jgi:hypothetical protein
MGTILTVPTGNASTMNMIDVYGSSVPVTGVTIKNLRIDGNKINVTGGYYNGIKFNNVATSTIENVYLSNGKGNGTGDGYGYWIVGCTDINIRNSTGKDWDFEPMEIRSSSSIFVTNNHLEFRIELYDNNNRIAFYNNNFYNLTIFAGTDTYIDNHINGLDISNNYFYRDNSVNYAQVWLQRTAEAKITNNYFITNKSSAISVSKDCLETLIGNNHIIINSGGGSAISINGASYGLIVGNRMVITGTNHIAGVYFTRSTTDPNYWQVSNNLIKGSTDTSTCGIKCDYGSNIDITDNYI